LARNTKTPEGKRILGKPIHQQMRKSQKVPVSK
jgi:hypothetical protein